MSKNIDPNETQEKSAIFISFREMVALCHRSPSSARAQRGFDLDRLVEVRPTCFDRVIILGLRHGQEIARLARSIAVLSGRVLAPEDCAEFVVLLSNTTGSAARFGGSPGPVLAFNREQLSG